MHPHRSVVEVEDEVLVEVLLVVIVVLAGTLVDVVVVLLVDVLVELEVVVTTGAHPCTRKFTLLSETCEFVSATSRVPLGGITTV